MLYNKDSKKDIKTSVQEQKFKLPADNYKIVGDGTYTSWSNEIEINEYDTKVINLTLNKEYKISGTIYTIDEKTPNPGISIELINLNNEEIQEITHSDDNGRFTLPT